MENKVVVGVSFVYGLHSVGAYRKMCDELNNIAGKITMPWVAIGDFNVVYDIEHRAGGNEVSM